MISINYNTRLVMFGQNLSMRPPLLSSHLHFKVTFSWSVIENVLWIEHLLRSPLFLCPKGDLLIQVWLYIKQIIALKLDSVTWYHLYILIEFVNIYTFLYICYHLEIVYEILLIHCSISFSNRTAISKLTTEFPKKFSIIVFYNIIFSVNIPYILLSVHFIELLKMITL